MRDFLLRVHTSGSLPWQSELYRRWTKLGGVIAIAFLSFAGINLIFGSREVAQATSGGSFGINGYQDEANLPFDFQFIGQGRITGGSDDRWMIGNVPILVGEHTQLNNELHPGDFVTLSGRILQNEEWLADRIELTQAGESFFTFNGPLEWVRGIFWRIGGHSLVINLQTKLGSNLIVNDLLLVTFTVVDNGGWLALEIKSFDRFPIEPTPIPTAISIQPPSQTNAPIKTVDPASKSSEKSKPSEGARKKHVPDSKSQNDRGSKGKGEGHQENDKEVDDDEEVDD